MVDRWLYNWKVVEDISCHNVLNHGRASNFKHYIMARHVFIYLPVAAMILM